MSLSLPNINRGVLILLDPKANSYTDRANSYFAFKYNPERLVHTFSQNAPSLPSGNLTPNMGGQPSEYFGLTFDLDSVDLDSQNQSQIAADLGIHPALAMLELMMQPQTADNKIVLPIVVFKWGSKRLVVANVVNMSVEEKTFDQTLNPIRATISLTLRVLNVSEVGNNAAAKSVCLGHQNTRITLADAYRFQTGQGGFSGGSGSPASALGSSLAAGVTTGSAGFGAAGVSVKKTSIKKA